jgi:hypothetical protein
MNFKSLLAILLLSVVCVTRYAQGAEAAAEAKSEAVSDAKTFCYVCNENTDKSCGDVYVKKTSHIQQCAPDEKSCRKIIQYVEGEKSVVRQCAKELYKKDKNYEGCYKSAGKSTQHVCTCRPKDSSGQDSCNHSAKVKSSILGMALIAMVAAFFY